MGNYGLRFFAQRGNWGNGIEILIAHETNGKVGYVLPNDIRITVPEEGTIIEPSLVLDMTNAQVLMDSLWDCGLRPSEGSGSAGALKATQEHLKDLQKIIDTLVLNRELPK